MDWTEFKEENLFHRYVYRMYNTVTIRGVSSALIFPNVPYFEIKPILRFLMVCIQSPKLVNSFFQNYPLHPQCVKIFLNDTLSTCGQQHNVFLVCTGLRSRNGMLAETLNPSTQKT